MVLIGLAVTACSGDGGAGDETPTGPPDPGPDPVAAPTLELEGHVDYEGSPPRDTLELADGEGARLVWQVEGEQVICRAEGDWSGERTCTIRSQNRATTRDLEGPGVYEFRLVAENPGGSDTESVIVDVADPGDRHARSDRRDDFDGKQVHLFYVVTEDGPDRRWDLDGTLADSLARAQEWFRSETGGREIRVDTYEGRPDFTFVRLPLTDDEVAGTDRVSEEIQRELRRRGFGDDGGDEKHLVYYDGQLGREDGGGAARDPYGTVLLSGGGHALTMIHELLHTLGVVDEGAPNRCDGAHVCDSARDLMRGPSVEGSSFPKILDVNGDDYYAEDLPGGLVNLYDSDFITAPE